MNKTKIFISITCLLFGLSFFCTASEQIGTLTPGLQTGMEGVLKSAPTASLVAGTYTSAQSIALSASDSTAICYTTNGSTPVCQTATACSTGTKYTSAISVSSSLTIKSVACYADGSAGPLGSSAYTINISTGGGTPSGGSPSGGGAPTPTMPTTNTGEVTVTPSAGGKTTLTTDEGIAVKIEIPANTVVSNTKFEVKTATAEDVVQAGITGSAPQSFVMVGGRIYQLTATGGSGQTITNFSKNITLSFTYTNEEIADLDEESLKVYRWDGSAWVALPSTVNKTTNTVTATTKQFSNFALMGKEKTEDEEETTIVTEGMTEEQLRAEIARLIALISALQAQMAQAQGVPSPACEGVTFSRSLSLGATGNDVKCLQTILNRSADTQVAAFGVGSSGNETNYFGNLTRLAVIKFQNKYASEVLTPIGLTTGTGYVGSQTIAKINQLLGR